MEAAPASRGPNISIPSFRAPTAAASDPEAAKLFVFQLMAWHRACGGGRPLREFLPLAMADRVSQKWAWDLLQDNPSASDGDIQSNFLKRFASEVRKPATVARDKLHSGKVTQKSGQDVVDYVGLYQDVVRDVPDMTEGEKIRWFQAGLIPALRTTCACDYRGCEFAKLEDCIQHAYGEERKLKITAGLGTRAMKPSLAMTSVQEPTEGPPAAKRARQGEDTAPSAAAATAAGGHNRGRGRSQGGRGNGRDGGRGGGGRGRGGHYQQQHTNRGGGPGNAAPAARGSQAQQPDPCSVVTGIHDLQGRPLTLAEVRFYLKSGFCLNCFKHGHHSKDCTEPRKPVPDAPRAASALYLPD
jgi:hypothetical protein